MGTGAWPVAERLEKAFGQTAGQVGDPSAMARTTGVVEALRGSADSTEGNTSGE